MKHDKNFLILKFHWNRLTPRQRKAVARLARRHLLETALYRAALLVFFVVAILVTPFPLRLAPKRAEIGHWL